MFIYPSRRRPGCQSGQLSRSTALPVPKFAPLKFPFSTRARSTCLALWEDKIFPRLSYWVHAARLASFGREKQCWENKCSAFPGKTIQHCEWATKTDIHSILMLHFRPDPWVSFSAISKDRHLYWWWNPLSRNVLLLTVWYERKKNLTINILFL